MAIMIVGLGIASGIARSLTGFFEHKLENPKEAFKTRKLVESIIRITILTVALHYTTTGTGVDVEPIATAAAAFLADKLFHAIKAE